MSILAGSPLPIAWTILQCERTISIAVLVEWGILLKFSKLLFARACIITDLIVVFHYLMKVWRRCRCAILQALEVDDCRQVRCRWGSCLASIIRGHLDASYLFTPITVAGVKGLAESVCLSFCLPVCLTVRMITQKRMISECSNLVPVHKMTVVYPTSYMILGLKYGKIHRVRKCKYISKTIEWPAWVMHSIECPAFYFCTVRSLNIIYNWL